MGGGKGKERSCEFSGHFTETPGSLDSMFNELLFPQWRCSHEGNALVFGLGQRRMSSHTLVQSGTGFTPLQFD